MVEMVLVVGKPVSRATSACVVLAMLLCLAFHASGEYESSREAVSNGGSSNEFNSCAEGKCVKRTMQEFANGMWFGPRLGKRHRSSDGDKQDANSEIEALANILGNDGWAVITIPASEKRQATQFTPRLGRGSEEDSFSYGDAMDRNEIDEGEHPLPPIFAPRLGRRLPWTPSPRLGRQLHGAMRKI